MKKKSIVLIAVLATVITISGCGSPAGKTLENVAGAAFKPYTEEMARNIYQYSE